MVKLVEAVVDPVRQINVELGSGNVQELDSLNQELTINELVEKHQQEQGIQELESLNPVQSEDRITIRSLIEGPILLKKGYKF
ncbi:hypothetical protein TNCV_1266711 [Trichonephila clavipes]|nr:hypothetical protein TNCV_1266711 [Trichonephila clavipes]